MDNKTASASRLILPAYTLTETCEESDPAALFRSLPGPARDTYPYRPVARQRNRTARAENYSWNVYPVVLCADGSPWPSANLFLMSRIEGDPSPNMVTYHGKATDLVHFRQFLDLDQINFLNFPKRKRERPTYAYHRALLDSLRLGEIQIGTAKKRITTLVQFYSWMIREGLLIPEHPPWVERDTNIYYRDRKGIPQSKPTRTTDLQIKATSASSPFDPFIEDEGRLRPLDAEEQEALIDSLKDLGNTTMTLIHYVALFTGARIQTVLTIRVRHMRDKLADDARSVPLQVGNGTGIDTKNGKRFIIYIPRWLYDSLKIYSDSPEAKKRRKRSGFDNEDQHLFLTRDGNRMYDNQKSFHGFDPERKERYLADGGAVRQFITRRVIPLVRKKLNKPTWRYHYHDLRASFGMNQMEHQMSLVENGSIRPHAALITVQKLLAHEKISTTEKYLNYRDNLAQAKHLQLEYEGHLKNLTNRAMEGDL